MYKELAKSKNKVENTLRKTINEPTKWGEVLEVLIEESGCTKGIILQREINTGVLMIPKNLPEELSAPLLRGFTEKQIDEYEQQHAENDPWTKIELIYPSTQPYALSSWLSLNDLKGHTMYPWLEVQGITDTVVMDVYRDSESWVAINLFFDVHDSFTRERCLSLLNATQLTIQAMWYALVKQFTVPGGFEPLEYFLSQSDKAEMIIGASGQVIAINTEANALLNRSEFPIKIKSQRIFIRNQNLRASFWNQLQQKCIQNNGSFIFEDYWFNVNCINTTFDIVGNDQSMKLLTFSKKYSPDYVNTPIWECNLLTQREKDLVRVLANGGRVVDFQKQYNLAKSTAHNYWTQVKRKLNIKDRAQLITINSNNTP